MRKTLLLLYFIIIATLCFSQTNIQAFGGLVRNLNPDSVETLTAPAYVWSLGRMNLL